MNKKLQIYYKIKVYM